MVHAGTIADNNKMITQLLYALVKHNCVPSSLSLLYPLLLPGTTILGRLVKSSSFREPVLPNLYSLMAIILRNERHLECR